MIALMGDLGELVVSPGSGRGLGWLRASIHNTSYFKSKISSAIKTKEYRHDCAIKKVEDLLSAHGEECGSAHGEGCGSGYYNSVKRILDEMKETDEYSAQDFYRAWFAEDLDEPPEIESTRYSLLWKIEALTWFIEELGRMEFEGVE